MTPIPCEGEPLLHLRKSDLSAQWKRTEKSYLDASTHKRTTVAISRGLGQSIVWGAAKQILSSSRLIEIDCLTWAQWIAQGNRRSCIWADRNIKRPPGFRYIHLTEYKTSHTSLTLGDELFARYKQAALLLKVFYLLKTNTRVSHKLRK